MRRIKSSLLAILITAVAAPPLAAQPRTPAAGESRSPERRPASEDELAQYEQRDQKREQQRKEQKQEDFEGGRGGSVDLVTVLLIVLIVVLIVVLARAI